jgi:hypothetical protein
MRLGRRLRRGRYDLVIDLHGGPRSAWLTWLSRAPQRIGYEITGRTWMSTRAVPVLVPCGRDTGETSGTCWKPSMAGRRQPGSSGDSVEMAPDARAEARIAQRLDGSGLPGS